MKKRALICSIAIVLLIFWTGGQISAATPTAQVYAGNQLRTLGVLKGSGDGSLHLENNITRAEVATIMVRILTESPVINPETKAFSDVSSRHWGWDYIQKAYQIGIIQGYSDGSFAPENKISYAEVLTIMVNALGQKDNLNPDLNWPENYIAKAKELGIVPAGGNTPMDKIITRGEMALIVWDTILVKK